MANFTRRDLLKSGVVLAASAAGVASASDAETASRPTAYLGGAEETKSLDQLYADAKLEGGQLIVYAGGDQATSNDSFQQAFQAQFPDVKISIITDYSKYHDVRVDNQLATNTLVPDVVQLQTLQDFVRWKAEGVLLPYKPAGFSALYPKFRDPEGAWISTTVVAFSYMYDASLGSGPATPRDLVDPRWQGAISSSYPHDDDAVLFLYKLYTDAYGWDWVRQLAALSPQFGRGTFTPIVAVASKQKLVGIGGAGSLVTPLAPGVQWVVPASDPFMAWAQRAAILKAAKHPAAAKLYLNWSLSQPVQQASFNSWSVRTDVTPPGGLKPIWEYPNAHLDEFPRFMAERAQVERWKQTFSLYFGEVQGPPSPSFLGLTPGA